MESVSSFIGKHIGSLPTPALVVNLTRVKKNCQRMREKCEQLGISLRPHVKTHKTLEGALIQTGNKRRGIVVSTVAEAQFFAKNGFDDIVMGRPATPSLLARCADLHKSLHLLQFLVNSAEGVEAAISAGTSIKPVQALIKVSTGYERVGIAWYETDEILKLAKLLNDAPTTSFQGLYAHCGNSYSTEEYEVVKVRDHTVVRILKVRDYLQSFGIACSSVGIGSTPSCSLEAVKAMELLTEVHAGNYAFYDCQQESYGACKREDIAARVLTRVVSQHPKRNYFLVDLGFTGLTKQGFNLAVPGYGAIVDYPNLRLSGMSQELGKIESVDGSPIQFADFPVDRQLSILPYHACATCGMYSQYFIHDDNDIIVDVWHPVRGW